MLSCSRPYGFHPSPEKAQRQGLGTLWSIVAWAPAPQHSRPSSSCGVNTKGTGGHHQRGDPRALRKNVTSAAKAETNYISWFSLVPSICFKCIRSMYTVGRWFLGERTAHQKNVWSGRSSSPSPKQVPASLVPQAATSPTKLAEAPQIPGVTNCLLSLSSAPGIRSSSRACRAKPKEVP